MKRIMFNERYGLQKMVLNGEKTQTRRIIKDPLDDVDCTEFRVYHEETVQKIIKKYSPYQVGDLVAVCQSYRSIINDMGEKERRFLVEKGLMNIDGWVSCDICSSPGYRNKMFVRADLMPHQIKILDVRFQLLLSISDEDCMAEGVVKLDLGDLPYPEYFAHDGEGWLKSKTGFDGFWSPRDCFFALMDAISGKGMCQSNPFVFAYTLQLIK